MRVEGSSISCGVRRLVIESNEKPSKEELAQLLKNNKGGCAIVMTGVPSRRRDVVRLLLDNNFEHVKNPAKVEQYLEVKDTSVKPAFIDMAPLIMYHDHEQEPTIDDAGRFAQFVDSTVSNDMAGIASLVLHHGNEIIGELSFFICYMTKIKN